MVTLHLHISDTAWRTFQPALEALIKAAGSLTNGISAPSVPLVNSTQCDGCNRGLPLRNGLHVDDNGLHFMACTNKPKRKKPPVADTPAFARFWAAYPRKQARVNALKAWHSKGCEEAQALIISALERQARNDEQWRKDGGKYIPLASTWLNGERWEDVVGVFVPQERVMDDRSRRALEEMQ